MSRPRWFPPAANCPPTLRIAHPVLQIIHSTESYVRILSAHSMSFPTPPLMSPSTTSVLAPLRPLPREPDITQPAPTCVLFSDDQVEHSEPPPPYSLLSTEDYQSPTLSDAGPSGVSHNSSSSFTISDQLRNRRSTPPRSPDSTATRRAKCRWCPIHPLPSLPPFR